MKIVFGTLLACSFALAATPVYAAEDDCLISNDPAMGPKLVDLFFFEQGWGEDPQFDAAEMTGVILTCAVEHSVPSEHLKLFSTLNVSHAMKAELRERLIVAGADVDRFDRAMAPHIPSADTTFDQMFDQIGTDYDAEFDRVSAAGKIEQDFVAPLLGAYSGAFHSTYVAQLDWDARK